MRYDKDCCSVICDAHELCFFAKRYGDLGSIAPIVSPLDIADGKMYYKIQSEAGAYYNPNVELSLTSSLGDIYFTLNARADGIIRKDGILTVDKIKAVKGRNVYSPPDELTLSLLKISCHLLCVKDGLEAVNARVTYYNTDSKKTKYFY